MIRGGIEELTERYRLGQCTPEEIAFVEKWVELNGVTGEDRFIFKNEAEANELEAEIWEGIEKAADLHSRKVRGWKWIVVWGSVAASVAVVIVGSFLLNPKPSASQDPVMTGLETVNKSINRQRILLPDSSVVTLAEGATIVTSENYGQATRTVRLTGEAFFEIRPNAALPFLVYSGDLVTEVLGTSFLIKPETGKKTIEVSVSTGKVSVYSNEKDRNQRRRGVIITPNQKAIYDTELKTIRQDLIDHPKMIEKNIPESVFNFDEVPVKKVLQILQNSYGMEIVVSNPELNDCVFTGNLNGFDLFRQLTYVCDIVDAQYEVRGTTIFLSGKGCKNSL